MLKTQARPLTGGRLVRPKSDLPLSRTPPPRSRTPPPRRSQRRREEEEKANFVPLRLCGANLKKVRRVRKIFNGGWGGWKMRHVLPIPVIRVIRRISSRLFPLRALLLRGSSVPFPL